ncbi:MAG TPA: hypothetical protein VEF55_03620 [Candidatus Binatia bacterium]|nr:hypothetical protein [Candidatus Binatia bacterium]
MLSSIFIALFQVVAGDPAAAASEAGAEAPAASTEAAPRTERRRVCRTYEAGTGGRLSQRRCRYVEVPVPDGAAAASEEAATGEAAVTNTESAAENAAASVENTEADAADTQSGGAPVTASPAPSPQ